MNEADDETVRTGELGRSRAGVVRASPAFARTPMRSMMLIWQREEPTWRRVRSCCFMTTDTPIAQQVPADLHSEHREMRAEMTKLMAQLTAGIAT